MKLYTGILICSALALASQTSTAQNLNHTAVKTIIKETKSANYLAVSDFSGEGFSDRVNNIERKASTLTENASVRSLYMTSEQFVFDNLSKLKKTFSVADIYFDLDQSVIRPDAVPALEQLISLMMEHPEISVAITSHSDSRFSKYNEKLALSRAQAAQTYLIAKGIGADRLQIDKHGRPQIANPCNNDPACSLATQQLNRKTEFNIIYNGINLGQTN